MHIFNTVTVLPKLPNSIERLEELAYNLWWSWNTNFLTLFKLIDEQVWEQSDKNPVKFLKSISQDKLEQASEDETFMKKYEKVLKEYDHYMTRKDTYFKTHHPENKNDVIAYFSAEYGLDETLALYSGGLGVLSGDHVKVASDLDLPFVALGLLYKDGYFKQKIDGYGKQHNIYIRNDLANMAITEVKDDNGNDLIIDVQVAHETIYLKAWQIQVGKVKLYLLDSDIEANNEKNRKITLRLYGGDKDMRIAQEIALGIGGYRLLQKLGITPTLCHMNEGHSAFLIFELLEKTMKEKEVSFDVAKEIVKSELIFTTHTSVPAGIDIFHVSLIEKFFPNKWETLGITKDELLSFGMVDGDTIRDSFNMGIFAFKFSTMKNGVSKIHGKVSREMFSNIWPNIADHETPITSVTNGIHTTWLSQPIKDLLDEYLPKNWINEIYKPETFDAVDEIENDKLWHVHLDLKNRMLREIKKMINERSLSNGLSFEEINLITNTLKPETLTIGFARRFATYKRATMLFSDMERLTQILNDETRPVQIIFAGKAHPADTEGQELIRKIHEISMMPQFKGKIILLENYSMAISRFLISGVDLWLNTPRRGLEACGTSGQKAAANGVLNFSTLDGWWDEGYHENNGWAIGTRNEYTSDDEHDRFDAMSLYNTLENEIIPMYYDKDCGLPVKWIKYMKNSIKSAAPDYSTARMLVDYVEDMYIPVMNLNKEKYSKLSNVTDFVEWKKVANREWNKISITQEDVKNLKIQAGTKIKSKCIVDLGMLSPDDVTVETYIVNVKQNKTYNHKATFEMDRIEDLGEGKYVYEIEMEINNGGNYAYTFRVMPKTDMLIHREDLNLVKWYLKNEDHNIENK